MHELPAHGSTPRVRADAARNRLRVLDAAERLFAERGPACVSMDDVAAEAGVGKGTVYRAVGDRAGLAFALLDARERRLQEDVLRGPAPLGPGAPALERARAFLAALADVVADNAGILLAAPLPRAGRYGHPVHVWRHAHLRRLLAEARPDADADGLASALLAALEPEHVAHLLDARGYDRERLAALARSLV